MAVERMEGVHGAAFSYENADGFVTFDSTATSVSEIIDHLDRSTGYKATLREREDDGR